MAPPPNDNFANAEVISGASGSTTGTVVDATREASESSTLYGGTGARSVWYKFTAPSTGWFRFYINDADLSYAGPLGFDETLLGMTLFPDGVLTAHTSTSAIAHISEGDADLDVNVAAKLTSGQVYYLRLASVDQFSTVNYGAFNFTLRWESVSTPANDDLANAQALTLPTTIADVTTRNSTEESGEALNSVVGANSQSRWYKFTAAVTGKHRIFVAKDDAMRDGIADNTGIQVYSEMRGTIGTVSGGVFTPLAGIVGLSSLNVQPPGSSSRVGWSFYPDLVSGTEYYLRLASGWSQKYTGNPYQFNKQTVLVDDVVIEAISPPANDNFANATVLNPAGGTLTNLTTRDATQESGEDLPSTTGEVQSVWFKFTPSTTGIYRFKIPVTVVGSESVAYDGDRFTTDGEIQIALTTGANVTAATNNGANFLPGASQWDAGYADPSWINVHSPTRVATLTSGVDYYIIVWSDKPANEFNRQTTTFDLVWEQITPPANDNFANRTTISGASGSQAYSVEGASAEASEPYVFWWWEGFMSTLASCWFEWTAPSSGWFEFKVADAIDSATPEMAIYTGSALGSLTPIARNSAGTYAAARPNNGDTTIRFQAVSGTSYKIQIGEGDSSAGVAGTGTLTWATASAPTGDTTTTALTADFRDSRVDNFGNTDDELPPNAITRLTPHGDFFYNDGQVGRSKWWKYVAGSTGELEISAKTYADGGESYSEYALLAYKGANFAALTAATTDQAEDAVMIGSVDVAVTAGNDDVMFIPFTAGETVWICMVGLYDADGPGGNTGTEVPAGCPQRNIDLTVTAGAPANDARASLLGALVNDHNYWLGQSNYFNYFTNREAGMGIGTTLGATTEAGDPATIGGFTTTRPVWYMITIPKPGFYKIWVESAVDCVLGCYIYDGTATLGGLIAEDDDSGTGNQPEIIYEFTGLGANFDHYWVAVDSKVAGSFELKYQRQHNVGATPPANDDFANAVTISSVPFSQAGTTVDANAEPEEKDSVWLGTGPSDSVWYKYTPSVNRQVRMWCICETDNIDAYVTLDVWSGTDLDTLTRLPVPDNIDPFYSFFDDPGESESRALVYQFEAGTTYYIRVQTESGGSEDFTIYVDEAFIYVNITAGGTEEFHGTIIDSAEIYVNIQVSSVEVFDPAETLDSGTVYVNITSGGTEFPAKEYLDAATVRVSFDMSASHECHTVWNSSQLVGHIFDRFETRANGRWIGTTAYRRFEIIAGDGLEEC